MAVKPSWLPQLLESENFLQYHAYYETFKHNHKAHGATAYARMGASLERVKQHCQALNTRGRLIPYNKDEPLTQRTEVDSLKSNDIQDYKGADIGYYKVLDHFINLYEKNYDKDIKKMIREQFPPVGDGPLISLYHGIIQLGYGYAAECDSVILEGLAYAFAQYSPLHPSDESRIAGMSAFGKGASDIVDILKEIREDNKLLDGISKYAENEEYKKKSDNFFDWYCWNTTQNYSDRFLQLTDELRFPEFFDSKKEDIGQLVKLLRWFEDMATVVYVKSKDTNNFCLLHGITGTWCLRQVIDLFTYKEALHLIRTHISSYLIVYAFVGTPDLIKTPEDYWKGDKVDQAARDIILREVMAKDFEDHVPKVTQILYEDWKENPDGPNSKLYIAGARMCIDNGFNIALFASELYPNTIPT